MKTRTNPLIFWVLILLLAIISACTNSRESETVTKSQYTIISGTLEEPINANDNLIYCASFQKAWDAMHDQVIKGDIILKPDSILAKQLNRQLLGKNDILSESYVAVAGELSNDLISKLNNELHSKFGELSRSEFNIPQPANNSHQLFAYAFLYKNLRFQHEFEKLHDPIQFISNKNITKIASFGIEQFSSATKEHENLSQQVTIFDYINDNDFIINLTSKSDTDEIILAKVTPKKSLIETYTYVMSRMNKSTTTSLRKDETLRIPIVDLDLSHKFSELENRQITNKGWEGWLIGNAVVDIRFKLDEKGAVLKSIGFFSAKKDEPEKPRNFIFDKPFLIFLKQKNGGFPYFAMWLNNSELFQKK